MCDTPNTHSADDNRTCETPPRARDPPCVNLSCPDAPKKKNRSKANDGPYPIVREIHFKCTDCGNHVGSATTSLEQQNWRLCRLCFREVFSQHQFYEELRDKRARCLIAAEQRRDDDKGKGKGKRKRGGLAPGRTARRRLSSSCRVVAVV